MKGMKYYYQVDALSSELFGDGRMLHLVEPNDLEHEDDDTRGMFRGLDKITLLRLDWPCIPHPFTDDQFRTYWQARWDAAEQRREDNERVHAFCWGVVDAAAQAAGVDAAGTVKTREALNEGRDVPEDDIFAAQLAHRVYQAAESFYILVRARGLQ